MAPTKQRDQDSLDDLRAVEALITARWGEGRMDPTVERIAALLDLLGSPQRAYRSIHLTGTNGKTTTARMIDELVRLNGLRTGRFTSPHLSSITERIVIDGEPVSARTFTDTYRRASRPTSRWSTPRFDIKLSFFEVITAMAYAAFADAPVDVADRRGRARVARWDATNQIDAEVAVITPIGLDHTEFLGDDHLCHCYAEKAGIIKPGATVIMAAQSVPDAAEAVVDAARSEVGATVARERVWSSG